MKIFFIGAVKFSASALQELIAMRANVIGVCTLRESTINSDHVDLSPIAEQAGIPVKYAPNINSSDVSEWIHFLNPDIIFCFGWSQIIKKPLLKIPPMGIVGYHPAALPSNRGRHPLIWALVLGLTETASTFFFMDERADSGDILDQRLILIQSTDDACSLYQSMTKAAMLQIRDFVPLLTDKTYVRRPQDHQNANVWRKRGISCGIIDWRMSAESIHNLVRGLTHPYIGAHFVYMGDIVKVWKTKVVEDAPQNIEPGKVLSVESDGVIIKAGAGAIRLCKISPSIALHVGSYL
jgi:methionyl-tRNA formyltransferase